MQTEVFDEDLPNLSPVKNQSFFAVILAAVLYGTSGVFIKYMSIPATSIAWLRTAIPLIIVAGVMAAKGRKFFRGRYKIMLLGSGLNAIRMYFFFIAYIYTTIGNAVIMYYTWPIFATIFSLAFLKERVDKRQILLLLLAFTGIIIAYLNQDFSFENRDWLGMSAAFLSAMLYAGSVIAFKSEAHNYGNEEMIFYQNLTGAIVFMPFFIFSKSEPTALDLELGTIYAISIGLIAYYLFFYGLTRLQASTASMLTYLEIVSALILSFFFFGEVLSLNMFIGGSIIAISAILIRKLALY